MQERQINVLPWPSKSPDLNPIENVWGFITKKIYSSNFRPRNSNELVQKIAEAWEQVSPEYTASLVASMPTRLREVIDQNGASTSY